MSLEISISSKFGPFCADGQKAADFRKNEIEPFLKSEDLICLDFAGVRNMNSSFANALVGGLISILPPAGPKLLFKNCGPTVKVLIESAISLGQQPHSKVACGAS